MRSASSVEAKESSMPEVSVVLPAYNAANYLREAVESILDQTVRDFELILINDGSSDATHEIAQEIASRDGRVVYILQENMGIVSALNRGLELCRGKFVARMDADDISCPDRFEKQLKLMRSNPNVIACGSDARLFGGGDGRYRTPSSDLSCRTMLLFMPCFIHPSVMFRRGVIDAGLRYRSDYQYVEDYEFWIRLSKLGELRNIQEPLLHYRIHSFQIGSTKREKQAELHVDLSAVKLAEIGVVIDRAMLSDLISGKCRQGRLRTFFHAARVLLAIGLQGKLSPLLSIRLLKAVLS